MIDVVMPQMGESIVEGTLTKWLKKVGERVERDEPLFEISTDKVDTEIPAPAAGTLAATLVDEGKTVAINTVVAKIDEAGDGQIAGPSKAAAQPQPPPTMQGPTGPIPGPETPQPRPQPPRPDTPPAPVPEPEPPEPQPPLPQIPPFGPEEEPMQAGGGELPGPLSPLVRRMAREHNLDLRQVKGTGAGGRITKQDVENHLARRESAPPAAPARPAAQPRPPAPAPAPEMPPIQAGGPPPAEPLPRPEAARTRVEPLSMMRTKIAEHMVASKRISAHVTTVHKMDMTRVAKIRARHKEEIQARYGFSLTYLPFVTRAAVEAIRAYPLVNASIEGANIIHHNEINVGIAVALENGLIVPVIRNADEKNVLGLQRAIVDLANRARSRQLKPDEVQGGTFSITNFGSFGSLFGTPIINQPQVAILGVGAVEKTPVVTDEDAIAIRSISLIGLTFDHRLIDGAYADQFLTKLKSVLENWSEEVL
jgi:pyruvate dehydrogenase E2 component (dihydrolipoamide acetyltransferase)